MHEHVEWRWSLPVTSGFMCLHWCVQDSAKSCAHTSHNWELMVEHMDEIEH